MPILFHGSSIDHENLSSIQEALGWLDGYLEGHEWAVGDTITIADHNLAASVSSIQACGVEMDKHPNVVEWMEKCNNDMPGYAEVNASGAEMLGEMFKARCN